MNFDKFSRAVATRFGQMAKKQLYVVDMTKDEVWDVYLNSFPEGTNPVYKERTYHDCNCCKGFIRRVGNVVSISNGQIETIWDVNTDSPYVEVAMKMNDLVKSKPIMSVFLNDESKVGNAKNVQIDKDTGNAVTWNHFEVMIPSKYVDTDKATTISGINSAIGIFQRGLDEIDIGSLDIVVDLINSDSIYRGAEHLKNVKEFRKLKSQYSKLNSDEARNIFLWDNVKNRSIRFKNTVIGTLVSDLASGVDIEKAVRSFEAKVAPANYKRSSALITPSMIKAAMATIEKLGIEESLERRHATVEDVAMQDVIWANRDTQSHMKGETLSDMLMAETATNKRQKGSDIHIDDFLKDVLPNANELEVLVRNNQLNNLVSVIAPVNSDAPNILKWNNNFTWSYNNNMTDSIKAKVQKAGGDIDAKLRISLSWFNTDDLDIHVTDPDGNHIYYGNKMGKLDVDMNVSKPIRDAVENVSFTYPKNGIYTVEIKNYTKRESVDVGFVVEVALPDEILTFAYDRAVSNREKVMVLEFVYKNGEVTVIRKGQHINVGGSTQSKEEWGIHTNTYEKVNMVMFSPNHWGGQEEGNKHFIFVVDKCLNPEPVRGIYNEFLSGNLHKHRKVFEVIADKTKCPVSDNQLSGVGFSSTKRDQLAVKVDGRAMNVKF